MELIRLKGRGAAENPPNRFERLHAELEPEARLDDAGQAVGPATQLFRDAARSILTRNDSPDVGFSVGLNAYRGCEHGCSYCYARPFHEYLGLSAGLDFETKILVKTDAPALLREELGRRSWVPQPIAMSGVTDPYQPAERRLRITRGCLEVLAEFRNPVGIVTKNHLVTRDADLLAELASHGAAVVNLSITTLDEALQRAMEPRASTPARRLRAIETLAAAGVPVQVFVAPVIPGLTDHELPAILEAAAAAGACGAVSIPLRLPGAVAPLFERWLEAHRPGASEKVLGRVRSMRGGQLNDARFGARMRGEGPYAEGLRALFRVTCRRLGLEGAPPLSAAAFRRPAAGGQMEIFG
jgi:DNA repair photolyase